MGYMERCAHAFHVSTSFMAILLLNYSTQGDRFRMSGDAVGVCCHLHCCHKTVENVRDYSKVVRRFCMSGLC